MNRSGNGLGGFGFTSFQEYIVRNVCKYYFALDPILKDRSNIRAWFTNEDEENGNTTKSTETQQLSTIFLLRDDESTDSDVRMEPPCNREKDDSSIEFEMGEILLEPTADFRVSSNWKKSNKDGNMDDEYDFFQWIHIYYFH